jgi:glycerol kinase
MAAKRTKLPKVPSNTKVSAGEILDAIEKTCGKPFQELVADGYLMTIIANDQNARMQYEKMILGKVVADIHAVDHTTLGQSLHANFEFPAKELPDWSTSIPVTITTKSK